MMKTGRYMIQLPCWPTKGCHILAQYDDDTVIVYQAFRPSIASFAIKHQKFGGGGYSFDRMSWIKPNFLWMMYRSGWAQKVGQERILAIHISRCGFDWILEKAYSVERQKKENLSNDEVVVRLQWDPDHDPFGQKEDRRAIQLGLRKEALKKFNDEFIQRIEDITDFVNEQCKIVKAGDLELLSTPLENIYTPTLEISGSIGVD